MNCLFKNENCDENKIYFKIEELIVNENIDNIGVSILKNLIKKINYSVKNKSDVVCQNHKHHFIDNLISKIIESQLDYLRSNIKIDDCDSALKNIFKSIGIWTYISFLLAKANFWDDLNLLKDIEFFQSIKEILTNIGVYNEKLINDTSYEISKNLPNYIRKYHEDLNRIFGKFITITDGDYGTQKVYTYPNKPSYIDSVLTPTNPPTKQKNKNKNGYGVKRLKSNIFN